jgi:hypothetical protein
LTYLPVIIVAALATAALSRRSPRTGTVVGITALAVAVVAVVNAEVTGNLLLFYLGALALPSSQLSPATSPRVVGRLDPCPGAVVDLTEHPGTT